jgi:hypothetical protein
MSRPSPRKGAGVAVALIGVGAAFPALAAREPPQAAFPAAAPAGGDAAYCAAAPPVARPCGSIDGCHTIAVVADTQHQMDGLPKSWTEPLSFAEPKEREEYAAYERLVGWLLARREPERIAFALHVGDAIQSGSFGQPLQEACVTPRDVCLTAREDVRLDPLTLCRCGKRALVEIEWKRFDAQWARLDGVLPYAIVRGNHDTAGELPGQGGSWPKRDPYGFAQHFGEARVRTLPGWVSTHLQLLPPDGGRLHSRRGHSHAWRFALGPYTVGVLGLVNDFARNQLDSAAIQDVRWMRQVARGPLRDLPLVALSHFFVDPRDPAAVQDAYRVSVRGFPERVFLAVQGHLLEAADVRDRDLEDRRDDRYPLLLVGSQGWPVWPPLYLVRFHFKTEAAHASGLRDEVEILRVPAPHSLGAPARWSRVLCRDFDIFYRG